MLRAAALLTLPFLLAVPSGPVSAQECGAARTQLEMNTCAAERHEDADASLNAAYVLAMDEARATGSEAMLREAQRLWIPFRDAACAAEAAPYEGGSLQPFVRLTCLERVTRARVDDLVAMTRN